MLEIDPIKIKGSTADPSLGDRHLGGGERQNLKGDCYSRLVGESVSGQGGKGKDLPIYSGYVKVGQITQLFTINAKVTIKDDGISVIVVSKWSKYTTRAEYSAEIGCECKDKDRGCMSKDDCVIRVTEQQKVNEEGKIDLNITHSGYVWAAAIGTLIPRDLTGKNEVKIEVLYGGAIVKNKDNPGPRPTGDPRTLVWDGALVQESGNMSRTWKCVCEGKAEAEGTKTKGNH